MPWQVNDQLNRTMSVVSADGCHRSVRPSSDTKHDTYATAESSSAGRGRRLPVTTANHPSSSAPANSVSARFT